MYESYFERLSGIYRDMDASYEKAASQYGFDCRGCENNCCLTRFYHHTFVEYLYLLDGFGKLDAESKDQVREAAISVEEAALNHSGDEPFRMMCPLNRDGLCVLYAHRPMICRMHGIPHELRKPGMEPVFGPGCDIASARSEKTGYVTFDRTPFYVAMAGLERSFREEFGKGGKIRMTIAQMLKGDMGPAWLPRG